MVSYFICIDWIVFRNFIFINGSCFITKTVYISNRFIILLVCEISYLFIWIDINIIRIFNRIQITLCEIMITVTYIYFYIICLYFFVDFFSLYLCSSTLLNFFNYVSIYFYLFV